MIFATSWMRCLVNDRAPFVRTNKFRLESTPCFLENKFLESLLGVGLLTSTFVLLTNDFIIAPIGALFMGIGRFGIFWIEAQLKIPTLNRELEPAMINDVDTLLEQDAVETEAA